MRRVATGLIVLAVFAGVGWYMARTYFIIRPPAQPDEPPPEGEIQPGLQADGTKRKAPGAEAPVVDAGALFRGFSSKDAEEQLAAYEVAVREERLPFDEDLARLMIEWLGSGNRVLEHRANVVLLRIGPRALPFIEPLLRSADGALRVRALTFYGGWKGFGFEGVAYPPMLPFLEDEDDRVRRYAMGIVSRGVPYDEKVAVYLLEQVRPAGGALYYGPEAGLARMGPEGVAHLLAMLDDPKLLYNGLGGLRSAPADVIRSILPRLGRLIEDDGDEDAQLATIPLLFKLEGDFEVLLPVLEKALEGDSYGVREQVLMALEQMEDRAAPAMHALLVALGDSDDRLAGRAAGILGNLQAEPEKVLPALRAALAGDAGDAAGQALGSYGPVALPYVRDALDRGDEDERYAALYAVAALGPLAESLCARVISLLEVEDYELQVRAAAALGRMGPKGAPGIAGILRLLQEDVLTPGSAAGILMQIGLPAQAEILAALRSGEERRSLRIMRVLIAFHGRTAFALDDLAPFLAHADPKVRRDAVLAIAASIWPAWNDGDGKPAGDAVAWRKVRGLLAPLQKDPDGVVRSAATRNVTSIDRLLR